MRQTLAEWLDHAKSLSVHDIDMTLERILPVARRLSVTQFDVPVITVGGTNGKGTTTHLLTALYASQGYRVGLFTSPSIQRVNEQLLLNGEMVTDAALAQAMAAVEAVRDEVSLTYYEYLVLAVLWQLKQADLDVVVLEVCLGGRLDAVNVVNADVAVITTIDLDHQAILGGTRAAIAREKAGIFRADKPVVCGESNPPETLLAHAESLGCPVSLQGQDFVYSQQEDTWSWQGGGRSFTTLPLPNIPVQNAATALMVLSVAPLAWHWQIEQLAAVMRNFSVAGRMQRMSVQGKTVLIDVAHNQQSAQYLAEYLHRHPVKGRNIAVFSALADKDIEAVVSWVAPHASEWHSVCLDDPRAASRVQLQNALPDGVVFHQDAQQACGMALHQAEPEDRVVIFGSFVLVGAALAWLESL